VHFQKCAAMRGATASENETGFLLKIYFWRVKRKICYCSLFRICFLSRNAIISTSMNHRSYPMQETSFARVSNRDRQNSTRRPSDSKRVVFSSNDHVRIFEPDLLHDDEAFICTAREFLRCIENDERMKKGSRWFTSPFNSEPSMEFDDGKIEKFREAFEHRLKELPEVKNGRFGKVDAIIRDLAHTIRLAGWPGMASENGKENLTHGSPSFTENGYLVKSKSNSVDEIDLIKQRIRSRFAEDTSVETVLNEMRFLREVSSSTAVVEVKELCAREMKVMAYILEDMGYICSAPDMYVSVL